MTDRHFFKPRTGMTVGQIVAMTGAEPVGDVPLDFRVTDVGQVETAGPTELVFLEGAKYAEALATTEAGVCLTLPRFEGRAPKGVIVLRSKAPYRDYVAVTRALYPETLRPEALSGVAEGTVGAFVHPSAQLEEGVVVEPGAVVGPRAAIGSGTLIGAGAAIGPDVQIGRDCSVGAGASVTHALVGDHVILYPGCRIGQDGFRYHPGPKGHVKVPQIGRVIIQDHVEIGANTTIDRGGNGDTVIGEGTKIDNLVQIGHNCVVGRHCIIVSQCGLSGSVVLGDYVMLAGQVGIADHVTIGEGAMLAARTGVMQDIPPGGQWAGAPAMPIRDYMRLTAAARR